MVNGQGTRVAIVTTENKLHYVVVKLGRDLGDRIEVLSGLSGDETVIANPDDSLEEGATVKPIAEAK
jgi:multidrug efflux pump subunit AcrA (membrane-fusion protein)